MSISNGGGGKDTYGLTGDVLPPSRVDFLVAWEALEDAGQCDVAGGLEYERVRMAWERAGFPPDIRAFIVNHANRGPDGREED